MAEYIERFVALDAIDRTDWYQVSAQGNLVHGASEEGNAWYKAVDVYKALHDIPAADVTPVVHGRWEIGDYYDIGDVCSVCDYDSELVQPSFRFCPHCGAKMDLEGGNHETD